MTVTRQQVLDALHLDDPFPGFPIDEHPGDLRGWNSVHSYLVDAMSRVEGPLVVEVGVWLGGSTVTMANALRRLGSGGVVIAVDTFLGSVEHQAFDEWRPVLRRSHGWPQMYYTFLTNCIRAGLTEYVVPLPLDSVNAYELLRRADLHPDVVHVDAGHDYRSVSLDIAMWFDLLLPGGLMICDDYPEFPGVARAVDEFLGQGLASEFHANAGKCSFVKVAAT